MDRKIVEFLKAGKGINKIARELHVGKRRVSRLRILASDCGYLSGAVPLPPYPEALFPDPIDGRTFKVSEIDCQLAVYLPWIEERLRAGWLPITILEELPIKVGRSSFYRFLTRHKLDQVGEEARRRVVPEIIHQPGEALLVDWGKLTTVVDEATGKKRTLWMFIGVLGYSRYMMVRLVWSMDVVTTLNALESMFSEVGGVPTKITSDNPKCFALEASRYEALINPAYEKFASYYGTTVECLPPRDPQKKGKVERPVSYVRRLYQAHQGNWVGLEESQEYMTRKVAIANERKHGTTMERPIDRLINEEASHLKALPKLTYETHEYHEGKVRKDGHVRFRGKYYSVDESYRGESVQIIATSQVVCIYLGGKLLETHERVRDRNQSKSTKPQHLKPWERSLKESSIYRGRAQQIGPYADQLITMIIGAGLGYIDFRKVWGILSLDKKYEAKDINEACRMAIEMGRHSYRSVKTFLELGFKAKQDDAGPIPLTSPQDGIREATNMYVRSLEEYRAKVEQLH